MPIEDYLSEYYLAYGSNLNIEDMVKRCPDALFMETDLLCDRALTFKGEADGRGFLTLVGESGSKVNVALWKLTERDVRSLDDYEELGDLYEIEHLMLGNKRCFTYVMKSRYPSALPSAEYMKKVEKGYQDCGFDLCYLQQALLR